MKKKSIWSDYLDNNKSNELKDNIDTDILIIGGGITGINTAYFLKDYNKKITLIDANKIGSGISLKTTAKISYLEQDIYRKLVNMHGLRIAKKYYESRIDAIKLLTNIIKDNNIDCDLEKVSSVLFTNDKNNYNKLQKEKELLESFGEFIKEYKDEFIEYGIIVDNTYTFNPIKYINGIRKIIDNKIDIYENTRAISIKKLDNKYIVTTENGIIKTNKIILACHYPFFVIPYFFPIRTYIEREYVCACKENKTKNMTFINIDKYLHSVRYYKDYLIYVSHDHKLTSKIDYAKNYMNTKELFVKYFHKEPEYMWINQDIVSNDKIPLIGKINDNMYISTSYGAWGMTSSIIGAKLISDLICNKDNKYESLFNPKRINIPLIFNSILGIFNYLKVYIESPFHKSNPYYVKINGFIYGIYVDKKGIKHKVKLICPHMKCSLVFNKEELTWDCPCHGSRFDIDGNIINSPTVKKI